MGGDERRRLLVRKTDRVCHRLHRLRLLQQGTELSAQERNDVRAHLLNPCKQCLAFLEGPGGRSVVLAVAGPAAHLTKGQSDAMFSAALGRARVDSVKRPAEVKPVWTPAESYSMTIPGSEFETRYGTSYVDPLA